MKPKQPRILILNAALAGGAGNTAVALERVGKALVRGGKALVRGGKAEVRVVTLAAAESERAPLVGARVVAMKGATRPEGEAMRTFAEVKAELAWAEGFVFGTGTHWDSWSSVLQKFLEDATEAEGTKVWLGKPAACVVTEHSVGGKSVLSRLQGVLVTLGCLIPPMSGVVLSKVAQMAGGHSLALVATEAKGTEDFWGAEDLKIVAHNLIEAVKGTRKWKAWAVDREDFSARWIE